MLNGNWSTSLCGLAQKDFVSAFFFFFIFIPVFHSEIEFTKLQCPAVSFLICFELALKLVQILEWIDGQTAISDNFSDIKARIIHKFLV
jgi:hypothetical protein